MKQIDREWLKENSGEHGQKVVVGDLVYGWHECNDKPENEGTIIKPIDYEKHHENM